MHTDISRLKYLTFKTFCIILFPTEETKTNYSPITQLGIYLYVYGSLRQVYIMKLLHRFSGRYKKKEIDQRRYFWKKALIILCVLNTHNGRHQKAISFLDKNYNILGLDIIISCGCYSHFISNNSEKIYHFLRKV